MSIQNKKVTIGQFFLVQKRILAELFHLDAKYTFGVLLLSLALTVTSFFNLKLTEYTTNLANEVSSQMIDDVAKPLFIIGILFLSLLIMQLIGFAYSELHERYVTKVTAVANEKINRKLSHIKYEYYESNTFYEQLNLANRANTQYDNAVLGVVKCLRLLITIVGYTILLSKIHFAYVAVIFLSLLISSLLSAVVTDKQLDYWRSNVSPESRKARYFKGVFGARINHANIQTKRAFGLFASKVDTYGNNERIHYLKLNLLSFASELLVSLLFAATFYVTAVSVGKGVVAGDYTVGYFTMVVALVTSLFNTIKDFTMFLLNHNEYIRIMQAYYDVMEFSEASSQEQTADNGARLILNGVQYIYPQAQECALKDINLTFQKGEKIALVGLNGSGKTTLVSLILSLLSATSGEIAFRNLYISAVLQDFGQYSLSVKENIELGCGGKPIERKKVEQYLKAIDLYDAVSALPNGMDTVLGPLGSGIGFSRGQWQRLAICRLLANEEANVWILDEPTAFQDPIAEIELYKRIQELSEDKLVFFISHRLGFARNADRIIVLDQGAVKEEGTHTELMKTDSLYRKMYEMQKEWYS